MTIEELLEEAKKITISSEEIEEIEELRNLLIQQGIEGEEQERRNYSFEVLNRRYNL